MNDIIYKKCCLCKETSESINFTKNKSGILGLSAMCKHCIKKKNKEYYAVEKNRTRQIKATKEWQEKNPQKVKDSVSLNKKKQYNRLRSKYSKRMHKLLFDRKQGLDEIDTLIGCSPNSYKIYISSLLLSGMTWENYGSYWCIDHFIPIRAFNITDRKEAEKAYHYLNSAPMTISRNSQKLDKMPNGTLARDLYPKLQDNIWLAYNSI